MVCFCGVYFGRFPASKVILECEGTLYIKTDVSKKKIWGSFYIKFMKKYADV